MRKAIFSIHITPPDMTKKLQDAYALSGYFQAKYAQRCEADLILKTSKTFFNSGWQSLERLEMGDLFDTYDRILYVDADVLIKPDAPNIFSVLDDNNIHMLNESNYNEDYMRETVRPYINSVHNDYPTTDHYPYYNAGVMLMSKCHRNVVSMDKDYFEHYRFEQDYINYNIFRSGWQVKDLSLKWNGIILYNKNKPFYADDVHFIHYITGTGKPEDREKLADDARRLDQYEQ